MAKQSSRQKKKQQRKTLLQQALDIGISKKQLNKATFTELPTIIAETQEAQKKAAQKERRNAKQTERRHKAKQSLLDAGYKESEINSKMYTSQKVADQWIDYRRLEMENRKLSPVDKVDWHKKYHTEKGFYIAFRDLTQEFTLQDIIKEFKKLSPAELVESLKAIRDQKPTFNRKQYQAERRRMKKKGYKEFNITSSKGGSSGRAGNVRYQYAEDEILEYNKRKKGWQTVNGGKWHDFTLYKITMVITAIMYHITEGERQPLYQNFYMDICEIEPLLKEVLK